MTSDNIALTRLQNQQIACSDFKSVKELVGYMGAMQAQDYAMSKWAIGVRLPGATDGMVEEAIAKGEIIRTHLMRPTWHMVAAEDIYWMLELTAPQIKSTTRSRNKDLGLTEDMVKKSNRLLAKALEGGKHLTREALMKVLGNAGIPTHDYRSGHLMLEAELDGIVCSGATIGKKQTYALLSERVPQKRKLHKDEALAELAKRYFNSHGPASLQDFIWWSGLPVASARKALEMVKPDFLSETLAEVTYYFPDSLIDSISDKSSVHLLPAFDEYLISYKDRTASLAPEHGSKAASSNGIFWPIMVVEGQVKGLWKRTVKKDKVLIETKPFGKLNKKTQTLISKSAEKFGRFLEKQPEVKHPV